MPSVELSLSQMPEEKMSYGIRFSAWLLEMFVEAILFLLIIKVIGHIDGTITIRDVTVLLLMTFSFLALSGYAETTWAIRLFVRERWLRFYPIIAVLLFLAHFEVMNLIVRGGVMDAHGRFELRVLGSGVVLVVTTATTLTLERIRKRGLPSVADNAINVQ